MDHVPWLAAFEDNPMKQKINELKPPTKSTGDVAHSLMKAGLGSIPLLGATTAELFQLFMQPPIERRRDEWMHNVGEQLRLLEMNHGVSLEDLQQNDEFIDTVMQATQVAMRNSQQDKRQALQNAIANSALPHSPDEADRQLFLDLIDRFTVWHLHILKLFDDPPAWFEANNKTPKSYHAASLSTVLHEAYPELADRRDLYDQIWKELHVSGLTNTPSLHGTMSGSGLMEKRTTSRGQAFIRFITDPIAESDGKINET